MKPVDRLALLLALLVAVVAVLRFDGPAACYWDTYITAPAMHMAAAPIDFVLRDGSEPDDYTLSGRLPDDLLDPDTFGIITKDQRLGAGMTAAPAFAAFGLSGFRLLHGALWGLIALGGFLAARALLPAPWALGAAALLSLNPFSLSLNRLNPNVFALAAGVLLLALLLRRGEGRALGPAALAGLLYGLIGNIRPEAVVAAPAFVLGLWWLAPGWALRRLALASAVALLAISPTLLWSAWAFGDPLIHSSQYAGFEGFRPTFHHELLGWSFEFNGLLNWPFHDTVVRTPHFPVPTFVLVFLQTLATWGSLLLAAALLGWGELLRSAHTRRGAAVLLGWSLPLFVLLLPHENWDELKMTYLLLALPGLALPAAAGLRWMGRRPRRLVALAALTALLSGLAMAGRFVDVPVDQRWYVRFPGAATNNSGIELLRGAQRRDWEFFHTRETPRELELEAARLFRGNVLPARRWPDEVSWGESLDLLVEQLGQRELRVLAVWRYIYGGERHDVGRQP